LFFSVFFDISVSPHPAQPADSSFPCKNAISVQRRNGLRKKSPPHHRQRRNWGQASVLAGRFTQNALGYDKGDENFLPSALSLTRKLSKGSHAERLGQT
jgi:hypothetical protein